MYLSAPSTARQSEQTGPGCIGAVCRRFLELGGMSPRSRCNGSASRSAKAEYAVPLCGRRARSSRPLCRCKLRKQERPSQRITQSVAPCRSGARTCLDSIGVETAFRSRRANDARRPQCASRGGICGVSGLVASAQRAQGAARRVSDVRTLSGSAKCSFRCRANPFRGYLHPF